MRKKKKTFAEVEEISVDVTPVEDQLADETQDEDAVCEDAAMMDLDIDSFLNDENSDNSDSPAVNDDGNDTPDENVADEVSDDEIDDTASQNEKTADAPSPEGVSESEKTEEKSDCSGVIRSVEVQKGFLSYLRDLVFGLTAILLLFMLIFRVVVVSGDSMLRTLQNGDSLILISNVFYKNPKYGDVVVACKDSFKDGEPIIKRVIATEGQTVKIEDGIVFVNGTALVEPYTTTPTFCNGIDSFEQKVPEGCVFVMGDNRMKSLDSRSKEIGLIEKREILGKVVFLILPGLDPFNFKRDFSRIGVVD